MNALPQLFLNSKRVGNFAGHHPWVLSRSIIEPTAPLQPGSLIELTTVGGGWIGRGVYNPSSRIRVRLYQWDRTQTLDARWCCQQVRQAVAMRRRWMESVGSVSAVRWVNSEGDGLSGLIVDSFGEYVVVQITALALLPWLDEIVACLNELLQPKAIVLRVDEGTARNEGIEPRDEALLGEAPSEPFELSDGGVKILVELAIGQKTGYYLDQRANRQRAASWTDAGPMLDVCCYLGGFSLAASKTGRVTEITAVDSSMKALEQGRQNAALNDCSNINFVQADCFDFLEHQVSEGKQYQTIVLDPPRMAGNRNQLPAALRAYHRLNLSAVNLLKPGGLLVTCSCSGRVSRDDFIGMLASVSKRSRRSIQILESATADVDHPIAVNCPETEYLKCMTCRVG